MTTDPAIAAGLDAAETDLLSRIDDQYAWEITERLSECEMQAGTTAGHDGARFLADEMERIGLTPGATDDSFLEEFRVFGCEDMGSSVTVVAPEHRELRCKQCFQGPGTGADGVTAPVVFVDVGRWDDFEKRDVSGKIVVLHRADPATYFHSGDDMFYGIPATTEAAHRGAVGVLMDYPINDLDTLKTDATGGLIPMMYTTGRDIQRICEWLDAGVEVVVTIVLQNRVGHYPVASNVIGMIPGSVYPDEYVYLGAHFDHWFHGAGDDNAAVGSLLAIAKAFRDASISPRRTVVFAAFDAEEGGGHPDTWYEWLIGSFSHIDATLRPDGSLGPALHPERRGRIVAMLNMDQVAGSGSVVFVETTPDLLPFARAAAADSGLKDAAVTSVVPPPGAYDDWSFYIAGVPCTNISFWGPAYDRVYHTDSDTMANIDRHLLSANSRFNALATLRLSQTPLAPLALEENASLIDEGIIDLLLNDRLADAPGNADLDPLRQGLRLYRTAVAGFRAALASGSADESAVEGANRTLLEAARRLNPHLFCWDATGVLPPGHFVGRFALKSYAADIHWVNRAIDHLQGGDAAAAALDLENVALMSWARHVGEKAYADILEAVSANPHLLWADQWLPQFTDVHWEYMVLRGRTDAGGADISECLLRKRELAYHSVSRAARELGRALSDAADALRV